MSEEIKKAETTTPSLKDRIKQATQFKEPSKLNTPTFKADKEATASENTTTETKPTVVKKEAPKKSSAAWNSEDDFEKKEVVNKTNTTDEEGNKPPTEQEMRGGARALVGAYNVTQRGIYTFLSNKKLKDSFTPEQLEKINEIDFKPKAALKEEEEKLLSTWQKLTKKHLQIQKDLPLTKTETEDFEESIYLYQESTGKVVPPYVFALLNIVNANAKRLMDIYLD